MCGARAVGGTLLAAREVGDSKGGDDFAELTNPSVRRDDRESASPQSRGFGLFGACHRLISLEREQRLPALTNPPVAAREREREKESV